MDILAIIENFADAGGIFILALIVLYWNRVDANSRLEEAKEAKDQEREDKLLLIKTLQDNTRILSELETLVRRLNGKS